MCRRLTAPGYSPFRKNKKIKNNNILAMSFVLFLIPSELVLIGVLTRLNVPSQLVFQKIKNPKIQLIGQR